MKFTKIYPLGYTVPCIYGLVDPLDISHIRYIGIATSKGRPEVHLRVALRELEDGKHLGHRANWILKLVSEGRLYLIITVEQMIKGVSRKEICDAEIRHIAEKLALGHKLTNQTQGGDGVINPSEEIREKHRLHQLGKKHSVDTLERMSESQILFAKMNPEGLARRNAAVKEAWANKYLRQKQGQTLRKYNQEHPEKLAIQSIEMIERYENNPELREKQSLEMIERYKDPDQAIKTSDAMYAKKTGTVEYQIAKVKIRLIEHERVVVRNPNSIASTRSLKMIEHLTQRLIDLTAQQMKEAIV